MIDINVAFISYTFSFGGIQKSMIMIAQQLRSRGFSFQFISTDRDDFQSVFYELGECHLIRDEQDLLHFLQNNRFDIVQLNHSRHGAYVAYLAGIKRIVERVDGLKSAFMFDKSPVDCIIASTERVYRRSCELFPRKFTVKIVNGVDLDLFRPADGNPQLRRELGIQHNDVVIGYAGRMSEEKCLDKLIDVVHSLIRDNYPVKLAILGSTTRPNETVYYEHLQGKVRDLGMIGTVFFLPQTETPHLAMNLFDIGVYTAGTYIKPDGSAGVTVEGYTNALLEQAAMELPLVAANSGDVSGVVIDSHNGFLVELDDMDTFRQRLITLIDDPSLRKTMGRNGRKFIGEQFSIAAMADNYERLYRYLLSQRFTEEYPQSRRCMDSQYLAHPCEIPDCCINPRRILLFRSGSGTLFDALLDTVESAYPQADVSVLCHRNNYDSLSYRTSIDRWYIYDKTPHFKLDAMEDIFAEIELRKYDCVFFVINDFLGRGSENIREIVHNIPAAQKIVTTTICGQTRYFVYPL